MRTEHYSKTSCTLPGLSISMSSSVEGLGVVLSSVHSVRKTLDQIRIFVSNKWIDMGSCQLHHYIKIEPFHSLQLMT